MHFEYINNIKKSYFIYFDIDGFKRINDKYGHQMGDQFLIDLSKFFISQWKYNVIYYRLGGDEFAMYFLIENNELLAVTNNFSFSNISSYYINLMIMIGFGIIYIVIALIISRRKIKSES